MKELLELQKKLVPDLLKVMEARYAILQCIDIFQPIGRRGIAENTGLTERNARGEIEFLGNQGFLQLTAKGMYLTKEGKIMRDQLAFYRSEWTGLDVLEAQIKEKLKVNHVIIVPGNSDEQESVKQEMGKACVARLKKVAQPGSTIAVTGGTTTAAVAEVMTPLGGEDDYLFVPARGGIGEKVENQSNTIAAKMAERASSSYRLLYAPDPLSETAYQSIINEPSIKEMIHVIKEADVVVHGIGDAITMAERRKTSEAVMSKLKEDQAVSEAFGYYFNAVGEVVHKVRTVGLHLEDLKAANQVITVAGGNSKGQAIASYFQQAKGDLLITDEAAAEEILKRM